MESEELGPQCYGRQANFKIRKTDLKSISSKLIQGLVFFFWVHKTPWVLYG